MQPLSSCFCVPDGVERQRACDSRQPLLPQLELQSLSASHLPQRWARALTSSRSLVLLLPILQMGFLLAQEVVQEQCAWGRQRQGAGLGVYYRGRDQRASLARPEIQVGADPEACGWDLDRDAVRSKDSQHAISGFVLTCATGMSSTPRRATRSVCAFFTNLFWMSIRSALSSQSIEGAGWAKFGL